MSTWFFTTFSVSGLKDKVRYLDNLQQLFTYIKPEQIDIPPFVLEYDARVSALNDRLWKRDLSITAAPPSIVICFVVGLTRGPSFTK